MSKKTILFGVILIGSGLALLLEHRPFLEDEDTTLPPSPAAKNTRSAESTRPKGADKLPDETRESELIFGTDAEGPFSSVELRDSESPSHD